MCFQALLQDTVQVEGQPFRCDVAIASLFRNHAAFKVEEDVLQTARGFVMQCLGENQKVRGFGWKDIAAIMHVVDTDGCFVPDSCIIDDPNAESVRYGLDQILATNKHELVIRNEEKRRSINRLMHASSLTYNRVSVPYGLFLVSRNLEHALYDIGIELSATDKERLARAFRRQYELDPTSFLKLLDSLALGDGAPSFGAVAGFDALFGAGPTLEGCSEEALKEVLEPRLRDAGFFDCTYLWKQAAYMEQTIYHGQLRGSPHMVAQAP